MAYGEKYYLDVDHYGYGTGRISIKEEDYSGDSKELRFSKDGIVMTYGFKGWDSRIIGQKLELKIINDFEDFYEIEQLIFVYDKQVKVEMTLDHPDQGNLTVFEGFIEPQTIEQEYIQKGTISVLASNYLNRLQYRNPTIVDSFGYKNLIDILFNVLDQTGIEADIMLNSYLQDKISYNDTSIKSSLEHSTVDSNLFYRNNEETQNSLTTLEEILKAYDLYIYYWNGSWYIENYNSLAGRPSDYNTKDYLKYINGASDYSPTEVTESNNPYYFTEENFEDHKVQYQKGTKRYIVRLNAKQWVNWILPAYFRAEYEDFFFNYNTAEYQIVPYREWAYNNSSYPPIHKNKGDLRAGLEVGFEINGGTMASSYKATIAPKDADEETSMNLSFMCYAYQSDMSASYPSMYMANIIYIHGVDTYTVIYDYESNSYKFSDTGDKVRVFYQPGPGNLKKAQLNSSGELGVSDTTEFNININLSQLINFKVRSYVASDASVGQKDVEVDDATKFDPGQKVKIVELSGDGYSENNTIESIDYSNNILTMENDLQHNYEITDSAQVKLISGKDYVITIGFQPAKYTDGLTYYNVDRTIFANLKLTINQNIEKNYLEAVIDNKAIGKKESEIMIFSADSWLYMNVPYDTEELEKIIEYTYDGSTWQKLQRWLLDGRVQTYHKTRRNFSAKMVDWSKIIKPISRIYDDYLTSYNPHTNDTYLIMGYKHRFESGRRDLEIYEWDTFSNINKTY